MEGAALVILGEGVGVWARALEQLGAGGGAAALWVAGRLGPICVGAGL